MKKKKNNKKLIFNPIITIIILTIITIVASSLLSLIGFDGQKTSIVNDTLETSLVTINNIMSVEGLKFIIGNAITNLQLLEPLILLIISIICVGLLETSGLIKDFVKPLKKLKNKTIIFITILISIIFTMLGDYSYIILIPLIGSIYKELGKNPILGIIVTFLGITIGYGAGITYSYDDYVLGKLTQLAASIDVDSNYKFNIMSTLFIRIFSTFALSVSLTFIAEKYLLPRLPKYKVETQEEVEEEEKISKKGFIYYIISMIIMIIILLYLIVPGFFASGILLNNSTEPYLIRLLGANSPFKDGLIYIILIITMISSYIYGKNKNKFNNNYDYSIKIGDSFNKIGFLFILLFFMAQLINILSWTNIGEVVATRFISFVSSMQFSGLFLIITMFIMVMVTTILIPSAITKWNLMAPLIVPLFMRSNMAPDFTQFIFKVADGLGRSITPLFIYFIITLAFIKKYSNDQYKVTVFGTLKLIFPSVLLMIGIWLVIILGWYIIGLPIGLGTYPIL